MKHLESAYRAQVTIEVFDWVSDSGYGDQDYSLQVTLTLTCPSKSEAFDYQSPNGLATHNAGICSPDEENITVEEVRQNNYLIDQDGGDHETSYELDFDDAGWLEFIEKHNVDAKGKHLAIKWDEI